MNITIVTYSLCVITLMILYKGSILAPQNRLYQIRAKKLFNYKKIVKAVYPESQPC